MKKTIGRGRARLPLRRRVEVQTATSHAVSFVEDGYREGGVEILIDIDRLIALYGRDALANKSGRASGMNGCVEIVVVRGSVQDHRLAQQQTEKAS